jgi:hypothetical protein
MNWKGFGRKSSWPIEILFFLVSWSGVRLSPLGTSAANWPTIPALLDVDKCGSVGGMRISRGNRCTSIKPAPVPLCPPKIPHDLTWARTWAAAVGSRRLTAWTMARPIRGTNPEFAWRYWLKPRKSSGYAVFGARFEPSTFRKACSVLTVDK